ncbi:thaumatin-like protein 1 [Carex rostrata]
MATLKLYLLLFSIPALLFQDVMSTSFTFQNNCGYTVWPGLISNANLPMMPSTGFELQNGASRTLEAPTSWGGNMWARTNCMTDSSGKFSCVTGDCGGQLECNGVGGVPPKTLTEFTLQDSDGKDTYDISNVDGFNVPVSITPQGGSDCTSPSCATNINSLCPQELQEKGPDGSVVACKSACEAFNTDLYCCRGAYESTDACVNANKDQPYPKIFKDACPQAYSYAHDDQSSTFTCVGANYVITYCP